jgi:hypothetical protein
LGLDNFIHQAEVPISFCSVDGEVGYFEGAINERGILWLMRASGLLGGEFGRLGVLGQGSQCQRSFEAS